ncbi:MAG TPA: glycosyltransferase family 4 protein [Candidatus Binatia bacterium]|jgi:glycosyltransferase involved in cell wall biosynthesis
MLRILLLAPASNPDGITGPLIGYAHGEALARLHEVTFVIRRQDEAAVRSKPSPFHAIEVVSPSWLDRLYSWSFRWIFKNNYRSQVLTAFNYVFCVAFEWRAWRQTRSRIKAGQFDVALRLLPISSVLPSPFAFFLRRGPIPFVIGPINGGLPWPEGFRQAKKQKEWISNLRNFYRFLPFARSTYRDAAAIIAGSSNTYNEFAAYREKLFLVPGENGINPSRCGSTTRDSVRSDKLELIFVGGLVPYKACDLALRAAASLLQAERAHFTVVGDGPEQASLEQLTRSLSIDNHVTFSGSLTHDEVLRRLGKVDVLVFPSVHEFGGAVVFEALAMGAVPVVADFGGPGDVVTPDVGFKVPLTHEDDVVSQIEKVLAKLADDPDLLERLRERGMCYARESLSWDGKAQLMTQILTWVVGRGPKPDLQLRKTLPARIHWQDGVSAGSESSLTTSVR